MPVRISDDLKERIITWYYTDNKTMEEIRDLARCSIGLISNVIRNYREYGEVRNPFTRRAGRPRSLSDEDMAFIQTLIDANPSLYLDEIQQRLYDIREVNISISTISRALTHLDLSWKTISKVAVERDEEVRAIWEGMMAQYTDPDLFVALDESAVDDKTGQRTHGWSRLGVPCVRRMSFLHGVRYSILPALTTNGIVALEIVEGSITKEIFLKFLCDQVVSFYIKFHHSRSGKSH